MTAGDHTAALVARWVAWYTRHLPTEVAERRRAELASDLWEQRADARALGTPAPDDRCAAWSSGCRPTCAGGRSSWRLRGGRVSDRGTWRGWRALVGGWWLGLAALVAVCQIAFGVVTARDVFPGAAARGPTLMAGGLLMLGGLALRRRSRVASDLTIAAGALPGVPWIWTGSIWFGRHWRSRPSPSSLQPPSTRPRGTHLGRKGRQLGGDERMMLGNGIVFAALVVAFPVMMGGGCGRGRRPGAHPRLASRPTAGLRRFGRGG